MRMVLGAKCTSKDIEHEFLHTLGIGHTQSRSDRDQYVSISWENIKEHVEINFEKVNNKYWSNFGLPYDYTSVMHYGQNAFSKNGNPTIITKVFIR